MKHYRANPFANVGNIVTGSSFIGRSNGLEAIESRVIRPLSEGGSLAIVGVPRIGKTSLVYQALIAQKEELHTRRLLPICLCLANYEQPEEFFRDLVASCKRELEDLKWDNDATRDTSTKALRRGLAWTEHIGRIKRFFEKVRQANIRVIFILDEFDHARTLFGNTITHVNGIRDLAIYPAHQVSWVITVRRPINEIEAKTPISTLAGVFVDTHLTTFIEEDLVAFFERFAEVNLILTVDHKAIIDKYCGAHPYLLAMLGYHVIELYGDRDGDIDIEKAFKNVEQKFLQYYDNLFALLQEDDGKKLKKLLQILFGPIYGIQQIDVDEMLKYSLIRPNPTWIEAQGDSAAFIAFSYHFQEYLRSKVQWMNVWPLFGETEQALRHAIRSVLAKKYGKEVYDEQCFIELEQAHPRLTDLFQQSLERQKKDKNGIAFSKDPLDYTYPRDLFSLIFAEWTLFQPIFGKQRSKDKRYWNDCAELLTKVRNPLAHFRVESIPASLYSDAKRYCEEILAITRAQE